MEITTNTIQLTKKLYFNTLLKLYLKKRWWLFVLIAIMLALQFLPGIKSDPFMIVLFIALPLMVLFQLWRFANARENRNFFKTHYHIITKSSFSTYMEDGSQSTVQLTAFVKVDKVNTTYLLYLSKSQFVFIPETAFKSESDRIWFHRNIYNSLK